MPQVTFHPSGTAVSVQPGTSILEAARRAGVPIPTDCDGKGVCGKCLVQVRGAQLERLSSPRAVPPGFDLACRTLVGNAPVAVTVPQQALKESQAVSVWQQDPFPADVPGKDALVRSVHLEMTGPSLDDNRADRERLIDALARRRPGRYHISLAALRSMPQKLRGAHWRPHVVLALGPSDMEVLGAGTGRGRPAILAVDVGTTTIKARIVAPGNPWNAACYNSQAAHGPDVITRIVHCQEAPDGVTRLQGLVVDDVNRLLDALLERSGMGRDEVWGVAAAGNTTMMHLLLGLDPFWIRREPYVGCAYRPPPVAAAGVGVRINPAGRLYCLPSVSAFVGADLTAGVLATGLRQRRGPSMLIDLGTNGEIAVGNHDFLVCCSASAGPAFEGGGSSSGTWAGPAAIGAVWADPQVRWETLGGGPPVGICGSGYIDLLAMLVGAGVIDKTGRFRPGSSPELRERPGQDTDFVLVEAEMTATGRPIVLSQPDIDNLVRAKAAIYAAGRVLLKSLGLSWSDLEQIMLAGGFGQSMNVRNAIAVGLLPDVPEEKIRFVGNTSLQGAVMAAADTRNYEELADIAGAMTYFELSTRAEFMEEFVSACFLPHTDVEEFPSVQVRAGQ